MLLKNRLIRALEKDTKNSEYPMETNGTLFEGRKALQNAKNDDEAFQMAIGIYNWLRWEV